MRDPLQRLSGKCARKGCGKKLGPLALKEGDPFCSASCASSYHGVVHASGIDADDPAKPPKHAGNSYTTSSCAVCGTPWKAPGGCAQCSGKGRRAA